MDWTRSHHIRLLGKALAAGLLLLMATACGARLAASSQVKVDRAELPARYKSALPTTIEEMDNWAKGDAKYPPLSHVIDSLSFGQLAMFRRLESASQSVPAPQRSEWSARWYDLLEFQNTSPEFCNLARPSVQGPPSTMRMAVIGLFVKGCFGPGDKNSVLRNDTPNRVIVDYFDVYNGPASNGIAVPYNARLEFAAAEMITNGQEPDVRSAAFALIEQKNPRAEAALLNIYQQLPRGKRKDEVARALVRGQNPESKRIGEEICARNKADPICSKSDPLAYFETGAEPPKPTIAAIQANKARLLAMGFSKVASVDPKAANSEAAEVILHEAGYGYSFDVETGMFPNQHDSLLRNLARLAGPALDGVTFEEIAPVDDVGPYVLQAYLNGKRYQTTAKNLDDWYDVSAVFGLLNFIIADQKGQFSLVTLFTEDQTLTVIGGPKTAVDQALRAKLIRRGDVGRAEELGKGFEREVLKTLKQK